MNASGTSISVVLPTFKREGLLVDTIEALLPLVTEGDEILIIDQTPEHDSETGAALSNWASRGEVRWIRKTRPSQNEAMNAAARLARGEVLLFLDDDILPSSMLLKAHRAAHAKDPMVPAVCGQVLQPWNEYPVPDVRNFELGFDAAYSKNAEIISLMAGNFSIRRSLFIELGGMDENYRGSNYRNDSELAYRIVKQSKRRIAFLPEAGIRHLLAGGGNRAFGAKDSWGGIGGSIGDYYFALRCLTPASAAWHCLRRLLKEPVNRYTVRRPWLIPWLYLREIVAFARAAGRIAANPDNYIKPLDRYPDLILDKSVSR
ncbi:MAG TPA: glycosyltransferase [Blastocatellia bacterium]|nr:glycosyltransferase [Blastocatellia bacterium]